MRTAATAACLFALAACATTDPATTSPYQQPSQLMSGEIDRRIEQIPYQHRDELLQNLLWLSQTGEQTIPALLVGLRHESPKVRSSCAWVLGRLRDRRTVGDLQNLMRDREESVRFEAARSLVLMGDLAQSPMLIEGLDSDRKEVRYLCHEALKTATGHDFGYDHLNQNQQELQVAVLRWRQWWSDYSGDRFFAQNYERDHGLGELAAPAGETKPQTQAPQSQAPQQPRSNQQAPSNQQAQSDQQAGSDQQPQSTQRPHSTQAVSTHPPQATPTSQPSSQQAQPGQLKGSSPAAPAAPAQTQPEGKPAKPAKPASSDTGAAQPAKPTTPKGTVDEPLPIVELPVVEIPSAPAKPAGQKPTPKPAKPNGDGR